ncbi:MAG: FkbM family methyltransferase, partial [Paracoccaceae bacterium]|nr:FkbM family methyltransferase [Paracoccaceae bacterium]
MGNDEVPYDAISARYGKFYIPQGRDLIGDAVRKYGEWAQIEIDLIGRFVKPGDTILDVGSCLGTHAVAFSEFIGESGAVYAFEPDALNFSFLQRNSVEAGRKNIYPRKVALSSKSGVSILNLEEGNKGASHLIAKMDGKSPSDVVSVETIAIDDEIW